MKRFPLLRRHGVFALLFLVVAALRLFPLFEYQFTYDEIAGLQRVGYNDIATLMDRGVKIDAHPALIQVFLYLITRFTFETWIIKLPFILMSLGAVSYAYAFGLRNFSRTSGLAGVLLLGFSLPFVYHAPIARMYSAGIFFSVAMLTHFSEIAWRKNKNRRHYIFFTLFLLLGALNHHLNALYAATLFLAGLFLISREQLKRYIVAGGCAVLLYLPHLPVTLYQLGVGGIGAEQGGWLSPPRTKVFLELLNVICGTGGGLVVMIALFLAVVMWGYKTERLKKQFFLAALFLVNFLVVYLYSIFKAPIYQHSVMLFAGTGLVLALASALDNKREKLNQVLLLLMGIWLLAQTYFRKAYLQQGVKAIYEYQFQETDRLMDSLGRDQVMPLFMEADSTMRLLYCDKYDLTAKDLARTEKLVTGDAALYNMARMLPGVKQEHLVLASSMPVQQALAREHFPYLTKKVLTQGIHYKVYSKVAPQIRVADDSIVYAAGSSNPGLFKPSALLPTAGLYCAPGVEFPYTLQAQYQALPLAEGYVLLVECIVEAETDISAVECCISVSGADGQPRQYTAATAGTFLQKGKEKRMVVQLYIGDFHHDAHPEDVLKIYLWNRGAEQIIVRELTVKVVDHWHDKWHFWD